MSDKEPVNKNDEQETYWQSVRDFNLSRTPFWISFCMELIETIIPFLLIWLLVGPDFRSWNYYKKLPEIKDGFVALICVSFLIWAMLIATVSYFLKWQKADVFTYTIGLEILGFTIIMIGAWMVRWDANQGEKVIVRFVICIFALIPALFAGVISTTFARNRNYKIEEEDEAILLAYQKGEEVPTKQQLRIERAKVAREKRKRDLEELEEFKRSLDARIEEKHEVERHDYVTKKTLTKEQKRQLKLDAKEERKRFKAEEKARKHENDKEITGLD